MKKFHLLVVLVVVVFLLAMLLLLPGCSEKPADGSVAAPAATPRTTNAVPHGLDSALVARGAAIYRANCAACHGANAEGAPNWSKKGPDGKFPPPPLDASGHGWHHPKSALVQTIKQGTLKLGGGMPAWKDRLSDTDIEAVIVWIQARWPEDVYKSWALMDEKARRGLSRH